jgi:hypothetical protein
MSAIRYKDYGASVVYEIGDDLLVGRVLHIQDIISFTEYLSLRLRLLSKSLLKIILPTATTPRRDQSRTMPDLFAQFHDALSFPRT